jgi:hypothetical protein
MASNPVIVPCGADEWTPVATAVTTGRVYKISTQPSGYMQTIRVTGDPAPTTNDDGADLFELAKSEPIASDAAIDVYVKAIGAAGSVRVDL